MLFMKLIFKTKLDDILEKTLAAGRYSRFWDENQVAILTAFYSHTGLRFKQRQITVHIREDGRSKAGNKHHPMELSLTWTEHQGVACTLIHELAHRLIIGNDIEAADDSHYNYNVHRQLYLFLYDVYVDVLGESVAKQEVARESVSHDYYEKAWLWVLDMDYSERQATFSRLKERYIH
jgi:hypothetical protein